MVVAETRWGEDGLGAAAAALGAFEFRLVEGGADAEREALRRSITEYLLPRLDDPTAPLIVAVVGPSGSGKSTLVNSLAEARLAPTGPLRPTTRYPVAWSDDPLPASFDAVRSRLGGSLVEGKRRAPEGMVVVDTPPPDVLGPDGVPPVAAVLGAADVCVFVASALRYADVSGWALLEIIRRRNIPVVYVLNRLPPGAAAQRMLMEDMARRLAGRGLVPRPDPHLVLGIPESAVIVNIGGLFPNEIEPLRKELASLADPQARRQITERALAAGLADADARLARLLEALAEERMLRSGLAAMAADAYGPATARLQAAAESGGIAEIAGADAGVVAVLSGVVTREAGRAARRAASAWDLHPVGSTLTASRPWLWSHGPTTREDAEAAVREWYRGLDDLVLECSGKRRPGRRRLRRLSTAVRCGALDRAWIPSRRQFKQLQNLDGAVIAARRDLGARLVAVMERDAGRFRSLLGDAIPDVVADRLKPAEVAE
jgi:energy-coupling factor transporter ATP-binding protein EcfA2